MESKLVTWWGVCGDLFGSPATGPLTLFTGLHLSAAAANVCYQETVRAHIGSFYDKLVCVQPAIVNGFAELPKGPGLGTCWLDEWFATSQATYRISRSG